MLFLWSIPYIFYNHTKPLLPKITLANKQIVIKKPYFAKYNREKLYFIQNEYLHEPMEEIINKLKTIKCKNIVLIGTQSDYEYPLWAMAKKKFNNQNFQINHIDVNNFSNILEKEITFQQSCALVYFTHNFKNKIKYKNKFKDEINFERLGLLY
jgi:cellobiose-specific phosphotransferase system component IIB